MLEQTQRFLEKVAAGQPISQSDIAGVMSPASNSGMYSPEEASVITEAIEAYHGGRNWASRAENQYTPWPGARVWASLQAEACRLLKEWETTPF